MEFASLEDAFPNSGEMKRKKTKSKEGFVSDAMPPTDADRPATVRLPDVAAMNRGEAPDEALSESEKFQKRPTVNNALPTPKPLNTFSTATMPSYFGAEPFTNPSEDFMAPFTNVLNQASGYMLESDFAKSFDEKGFGKSAGVTLPVPELRHRWKQMSADRVESGQVELARERSDGTRGGESTDLRNLKAKIDELMARLDDLENRAAGANPQLEMMTFIMTGLFLMFIVDLAVRKSSGRAA
jgi:hypothetical protein